MLDTDYFSHLRVTGVSPSKILVDINAKYENASPGRQLPLGPKIELFIALRYLGRVGESSVLLCV